MLTWHDFLVIVRLSAMLSAAGLPLASVYSKHSPRCKSDGFLLSSSCRTCFITCFYTRSGNTQVPSHGQRHVCRYSEPNLQVVCRDESTRSIRDTVPLFESDPTSSRTPLLKPGSMSTVITRTSPSSPKIPTICFVRRTGCLPS